MAFGHSDVPVYSLRWPWAGARALGGRAGGALLLHEQLWGILLAARPGFAAQGSLLQALYAISP